MEEQLKKDKDNAYWERNQLVSALSKLYPSHLAKHPESDKDWEPDWRTIVVINIPTGEHRSDITPQYHQQLTWHIHDHDVSLFDHLGYKKDHYWDGHTTEEKYRRLRDIQRKD